ncbi:hypothetical protein [Cellulomonas sp. ATA003]|uniref:hypothetical protein n=1 Tax=Cellulomonas sp. ATA003 TaxID=3073064 RepID=UPI0037C01CDF
MGGLASALALQRRGWVVEVVERAADLTPVGSGIAIAPNGLRALDVLGLGDAVRSRAATQGAGGFRDPRGAGCSGRTSAPWSRPSGSRLSCCGGRSSSTSSSPRSRPAPCASAPRCAPYRPASEVAVRW